MDSREINEIEGFVKRVRGDLVTVESKDTKRVYTITLLNKVSSSLISSGDKILVQFRVGDKTELITVGDPYIEPPSDEDTVIKLIVPHLKNEGINFNKIKKVYKFFSDRARDACHHSPARNFEGLLGMMPSPVHRYPERLDLATIEMINYYAERLKYNPSLSNILSNFGIKDCRKFFEWWYDHFSRRRLRLLGLSPEEIYQCLLVGWEPSILYYQLLENPFAVEQISIDKAIAITLHTGVKVPDSWLPCGVIIRKARELCQEYHSVSVPLDALGGEKIDRELLSVLEGFFRAKVAFGSLYLRQGWIAESTLVSMIKSLRGAPLKEETSLISPLAKFLDPKGEKAVKMALSQGITMICGEGGSGKSFLASVLANEASLRGIKVALCSASKKGAGCLSSFAGEKIRDIKSLNLDWESCEMLIIDEAHDVDTYTLAELFLKLSSKIKIIMLGDIYAAPPSGYGAPFSEILKWGGISLFYLEKNFRIKNPLIYFNLTEIIKGRVNLSYGDGCSFIKGGLLECLEIFTPEMMVIVPDPEEALKLNALLLERAWLQADFLEINSVKWKVGTPVLTKDYEEGEIISLDDMTLSILCKISGQEQEFAKEGAFPLKELRQTWCRTIEESIGSTYRNVILFLPKIISREAFYMAFSRASESIVIVSETEDFIASSTPCSWDRLSLHLEAR